MNMMKALIPSTILTLIVSAIVGSTGARESFLNIQSAAVAGHSFYWSWTFFFVAMALNGCLVLKMAKEENASKTG
jgi:hypothetical protein